MNDHEETDQKTTYLEKNIQFSKRHRNKADGKLAYANEVYKYGECKSRSREPQYNIEAYGTFLR